MACHTFRSAVLTSSGFIWNRCALSHTHRHTLKIPTQACTARPGLMTPGLCQTTPTSVHTFAGWQQLFVGGELGPCSSHSEGALSEP